MSNSTCQGRVFTRTQRQLDKFTTTQIGINNYYMIYLELKVPWCTTFFTTRYIRTVMQDIIVGNP